MIKFLLCANCGKKAIKTGNSQKYCEDCQHTQNKRYREKNRKRLLQETKEWCDSLTPEQRKEMWTTGRLLYRYKLTPEDIKNMKLDQKECCKLCGKSNKKLVIDHGHDCCPGRRSCGKCIRGLLCIPCNAMLGQLSRITRIGIKKIKAYLRSRYARAI